MADDVVHLRASGVSLLLSTGGGRLPRIAHWGADLGDLPHDALADLVRTGQGGFAFGGADEGHALAVVPEHTWGWLGTPGLEGSRAGAHPSTRFVARTVEVSSEGDGDARAQSVVTTAVDEDAALELTVTVQLLGTGLVRTRARLTSLGGEVPFQVGALATMLPVPREAQDLLDFTGRWIRERTPQRTDFTVGTRLRESRGGKPDHDSAFVLAAGTRGFSFRAGEVWATHVAWSGNIRTLAERGRMGDSVIGGGELLAHGEVSLAAGESYESPWVYGAYSAAGLDAASSRFHRHLRATRALGPRPVTVNTWEAVYFDHDHGKLLALADAAAAVGAERFVLDDGWFRHRRADNAGLGDWYVDEGVYPDGLGFLAEHVRSLGLEFGLWVEPEMINPDSDLARAHPEWIARAPGHLPVSARNQQVLDLTHPEAYAYIEERLHSLVGELRPGYLKWDHNRVLVEAQSTATGRGIVHAQTLAFYRLVDGLKVAFPGLEIESCSGGGARVDLEVLSRTDRVWASDCNDPLERQSIQRWTQLLVPPEMMGAHMGPPTAHTTYRTARLTFRAATALFGHLGLEWDVTADDAVAAREEIAGWVALHKTFRPLLHSGTVVNSDLPEDAYAIHGVVGLDGAEALYSVASLALPLVGEVGLVRLEGLDPDATYEVAPVAPEGYGDAPGRAVPAWWPGPVRLTGRALAVRGVQVPVLAPEDAVLLHAVRV
ncbi:alpha-galactosidase [Demequina phytophila]|uniref:alpha-galactosidase n=1 Tax=Demequina phytophila TaxID=1638981 RepID=UPI0007808954|nr:alpha-galactosidase [Demequina phytophila]